MRKLRGLEIAVLVMLAAALGGCASRFNKIQPVLPDLQLKSDGIYRGQYKASPVSVVVDVEVRDNAITNIVIVKHFNGRGEKAEIITESVLAKQSLAVDTISGATASSKVILKAIENALE